MDYLNFWQYIRRNGLETPDYAYIFVSLAVLVFSSFGARNLWRNMRQRKPLTYGDVVAPFMGLLLSAGLFLTAYWAAQSRYLLRGGATKYTVAKVFKHGNNRGYDTFVYEYYVADQRYQSYRKCGVEHWQDLPCPALGTRYYVRFSPESPSTEEVTNKLVPDSVRTIPPLGWAKLP